MINKNYKYIAIFLLLLTLTSCSKVKEDFFILASSEGGEVYFEKNDTIIKIKIDKETLNKLETKSLLDRKTTLVELFNPAKIYETNGSDFIKHSNLIELFIKETGSENELSAYKKNKGILKGSALTKELDLLSNGFDSVLRPILKNKKNMKEYDLGIIINGNHSYIEIRTFLKDWLLML